MDNRQPALKPCRPIWNAQCLLFGTFTNEVMKGVNIIFGLSMIVYVSSCAIAGNFLHVVTAEEADFDVSIVNGVEKDKEIISIRSHHKISYGEKLVTPYFRVWIDGSTVYGDMGRESKNADGKLIIITPNITEDEMQTFWRVYVREVSQTDFKGRVILDIYPDGKKRRFSITISGVRTVTLNDAVQKHDLTKIREMIKNNPELVSKQRYGYSPVHIAAYDGDKGIMELLLAHNADANAEDKNGDTPLHWAAKAGQMNMVVLLLANKARVNAINREGFTPLHVAALEGHKEIAQVLLANKANYMVRSKSGNTPLHSAASSGNRDLVALLLTSKADVNAKTSDGFTPLHFAAEKAHLDVVKVLLANQAKVDARGEGNPLLYDCGSTPLLLLSNSIEPDDRQIKVAKLLLANGADVNAKNKTDFTPLHFAAWKGHKKVVELLLASNANVNAKDSNGDTPLTFANRKNHKDVVDLLRQNGGHE